MSHTCAICERPIVDQALICTVDTNVAIAQLAEIVRLLPDARAVAAGQVRRGTGGSSGKPGSRPPLDVHATDTLHAVGNVLTTIVRDIEATRGPQGVAEGLTHPDPLGRACEALSGHMEWLRHALDEMGRPYAVAVFAEIAACARRIRGVVDGPADRKYLGPCGYVETSEECSRYGIGDHDCAGHEPCDGDVYGRPGGDKGTCRTCGAQVDQAARRAWLDDQARASDLAWTARGIADALGINAKTLRAWATERRTDSGVVLRRAKLATYWHNGTQLVPWVEPLPGEDVKARGPRLHYVGDVMALAREAADRRAAVEVQHAREDVAA